MKTLILGLGKSGMAAYDLLEGEDDVVGVDDGVELVQKLASMGKNVAASADAAQFDRLVLSPGIASSHPVIQQALKIGLPMISEVNLALERMRQQVVGITGTNGKTTVTLLITHVLEYAGLKAKALGNIGAPLCAYVKTADPSDIAVIELSSYQLETLTGDFFDVGLILNITPDHLDRHGTIELYAKAKCRLQACMKNDGFFLAHESVATQFKGLLCPCQTYGKNPDCTFWTDRVALYSKESQNPHVALFLPNRYRSEGTHESENVLAAWVACHRFGVSSEVFVEALDAFKKPSHRIEKVASILGVDYIDDSKGTNIDATMKAVDSMNQPIILIVGGVDKGASYSAWKQMFRGKVRAVLAIGAAAEKIASDLMPEYQVEILPSLRDAVFRAQGLSSEGDVVLLSPGCSSYDMFRDYAHRGDEFKKFVNELKEIK